MSRLRTREAAMLLTAAIVVLALIAGYIHFTVGSTTSLLGMLFYANAAGYVVLALALVVAAWGGGPPLVQRFSWLPRVALILYAAASIGAYLVIGPYSTLGWITKAIEVAIIVLVVVDVIRVHGSLGALIRTARHSLTRPQPAGDA